MNNPVSSPAPETQTSQERIRAVLNRQVPDRVPLVDISYWPGTLERWRQEGLPADVSPPDYFGLDRIACIPYEGSPRLPTETLEETERYHIYRDAFGATVKAWKPPYYAPPARLAYGVHTWEDWLPVKERLTVSSDRLRESDWQVYHQAQQQGAFIVHRPIEPAWFLLELLMGFEGGLTALLLQPDLVEDILTTYTDFVLGMFQLCLEAGMVFDGLWFFSDLCFKNGMLFSPQVYRELIQPHHQRVADFCHQRGMYLLLHCDGDVREFIPLLIEAGFDAIQPLEARCGNDVRELKPLYGQDIVLFGNISADVMSRTRAEIEEEIISKITVAKEGGGYIYHSDHSIPPTVSFENYAYVIELVRKYGTYDP